MTSGPYLEADARHPSFFLLSALVLQEWAEDREILLRILNAPVGVGGRGWIGLASHSNGTPA
ncbi:hypothetical protein GCM10018781_77990 [Kitasatospora indigofera]|uniref:Uncharacterized protein n=1 Tax=Kitasatospora indigofera TaxID=67307 RepID=A0A919DAF1_9ACTN|nr:hypothetical protein [Kitasatospora indigofera]GHE26011.1 hypothetical protein GCM10018781_77990 [Kitasatospora indigofera]